MCIRDRWQCCKWLIYINSSTHINTLKYNKVRIVIPVVVGSSPISHPKLHKNCLLYTSAFADFEWRAWSEFGSNCCGKLLSYFKRFDWKTILKPLLFSSTNRQQHSSELSQLGWPKQGQCKREDLAPNGAKIAVTDKVGPKTAGFEKSSPPRFGRFPQGDWRFRSRTNYGDSSVAHPIDTGLSLIHI